VGHKVGLEAAKIEIERERKMFFFMLGIEPRFPGRTVY